MHETSQIMRNKMKQEYMPQPYKRIPSQQAPCLHIFYDLLSQGPHNSPEIAHPVSIIDQTIVRSNWWPGNCPIHLPMKKRTVRTNNTIFKALCSFQSIGGKLRNQSKYANHGLMQPQINILEYQRIVRASRYAMNLRASGRSV